MTDRIHLTRNGDKVDVTCSHAKMFHIEGRDWGWAEGRRFSTKVEKDALHVEIDGMTLVIPTEIIASNGEITLLCLVFTHPYLSVPIKSDFSWIHDGVEFKNETMINIKNYSFAVKAKLDSNACLVGTIPKIVFSCSSGNPTSLNEVLNLLSNK